MKKLLIYSLLVFLFIGCQDNEILEQPAVSFYPDVAGTMDEGSNTLKEIILEFSRPISGDANIAFNVVNGDFLEINGKSASSVIDFNLTKGSTEFILSVKALDDILIGNYDAKIEISTISRAIKSVGIGTYTLTVTDNERANTAPFFEDDFESGNLNNWTTFSVSGSNDWGAGSFAENSYALVSNFQSDVPAEDWLISPEIDFSETKFVSISFETLTAFNNGNILEVVVLSDYASGDPASSVTETLSPTLDPHQGSGFGDLTPSGDITINKTSGKGNIAFHFKAADESDGAQWQVDNVVFSGVGSGSGGGSGGGGSGNATPISEARTKTGETVTIRGIVTTPDYGFNNGQFFIQDATGGINIFFGGSFGAAQLGDDVEITGSIGNFGEQIQISPSTLTVLSSGNTLPSAAVVNGSDLIANSALQSTRITVDNVTLTNPSEWPVEPIGDGSGLNVMASADGVNFVIRIDRGESFYDGSPLPTGAITVTGVMARFNDEVQILPFVNGDITSDGSGGGGGGGSTDAIDISAARSMMGQNVKIKGIVTTPDYGFNNGQYFIQDGTGGINIFHGGNFGLVNPGDQVELTGSIGEFGMQIQIAPSEVKVITSNNSLPVAASVNGSDLSPTSALQSRRVVIDNVSLVTPSEWPTSPIDAGSGLNVMATADGVTFIIRIDRGESFFDGSATPPATFTLTGVLARFDSEIQILPFAESDIK